MNTLNDYALYKGEELLCIGTVEEIARHTGLRREMVLFYGQESYKRRIKPDGDAKVLVKLEED